MQYDSKWSETCRKHETWNSEIMSDLSFSILKNAKSIDVPHSLGHTIFVPNPIQAIFLGFVDGQQAS